MHAILFTVLLFSTCGYAIARGSADARIVGAVCILASFASYALVSRYTSIELGVFTVDLLTLIAFTVVALGSDRFWPLWVSGLQLTAIFSHIIKGVQSDLLPTAYAAALHFWSYPILIILAVGTWRAHQRSLKEQRT